MKLFRRNLQTLEREQFGEEIAIEIECDGRILSISDPKYSQHGFDGFDVRSPYYALMIVPLASNAVVVIPQKE